MDLSICSQKELDAIVLSLNAMRRETPGWKMPLVGYTGHMVWLNCKSTPFIKPQLIMLGSQLCHSC
jgi:hypothetical protein